MAHRTPLRTRYPELFRQASELLYRIDPMGINFGTNTDEYEPEVGTILPRLVRAPDPASARQVVHEEFEHWFGNVEAARPALDEAAEELWTLVRATGLAPLDGDSV